MFKDKNEDKNYLYHFTMEWGSLYHSDYRRLAGAITSNKRITNINEYNETIELIKKEKDIPRFENVIVTSFNIIE